MLFTPITIWHYLTDDPKADLIEAAQETQGPSTGFFPVRWLLDNWSKFEDDDWADFENIDDHPETKGRRIQLNWLFAYGYIETMPIDDHSLDQDTYWDLVNTVDPNEDCFVRLADPGYLMNLDYRMYTEHSHICDDCQEKLDNGEEINHE
jgi:hypothetical protein